MAKETSARRKTGGRKKAAKRELIDTGTDKRYVRRGAKGRFKESDDVGRWLSADRRRQAKTKAKRGQGDKGRHKRAENHARSYRGRTWTDRFHANGSVSVSASVSNVQGRGEANHER